MFLDELDPKRGRMDLEVMEDCGIACQLFTKQKVLDEIKKNIEEVKEPVNDEN